MYLLYHCTQQRVSPQSSTIMFSALGQQQQQQSEPPAIEDGEIGTDHVAGAEEEREKEDEKDEKDETGEEEKEKEKEGSSTTVDVLKDNQTLLAASKSLLSRSGFQIDDLLAKSVCSSLSLYRDALDISPGDQLRYLDFAPMHRIQTDSDSPLGDGVAGDAIDEEEEEDYFDGGGGGDAFGDDNDDDDDDNEGGAFFGESTLTAESLAAHGKSTDRRSSGSSDDMSVYSSASKIQWDAVYEGDGESDSGSSGVLSVNDTNPIGFQSSKQNAASTAAFLAMHTGATNQWAGAKHWRRSARQKPANKATIGDDDTSTKKKTTKSRAKKEKFRFDFSKVGEGVSEQINAKFEKVKGSKKLNPTVLSDAVVQKGVTQAQEGLYTLPADARLNTKDLCRCDNNLYCCYRCLFIFPSYCIVSRRVASCRVVMFTPPTISAQL
jgi:hypothetical protein